MVKQGDNSDDVRELQTYLTQLGFPCKVDGSFGPATTRAVIEFQKMYKLAPDGIVGDKTIEALGEALKIVPGAERIDRTAGGRFDSHGYDRDARQCLMHSGRIGAEIDPIGAVVHTTDCMPGTMPGIIKRWAEGPGERNGATYMIGRTPADGLVQLAPITRNTGHAGGFQGNHGWLVKNKQRVAHPNSVYVGIELDCAGRLSKGKDKWRHNDSGKMLDAADVYVHTDGSGWHLVTEYQFEVLGKLLDALDERCRPVPEGWTIAPHGAYGSNGVRWAPLGLVRFTTHVELDPIRKTDPGPQVTEWLRARYGALQSPRA